MTLVVDIVVTQVNGKSKNAKQFLLNMLTDCHHLERLLVTHQD